MLLEKPHERSGVLFSGKAKGNNISSFGLPAPSKVGEIKHEKNTRAIFQKKQSRNCRAAGYDVHYPRNTEGERKRLDADL